MKMTSPLVVPATALSVASLVWTTWSLVDLLGAGPVGFTVAAGADVIWASVILAEARGLRVSGRTWIVPALGWAGILAVAGLLIWHGITKDSAAMAAAGPLLPLGAKAVWLLALADMRNPSALTDEERLKLAAIERGMVFEEAMHDIEMRRRRMGAELVLTEVAVDFDIEISRQEKGRELTRRRPLELPASPSTSPRTSPSEAPDDFASTIADASPSRDANIAAQAPGSREVFGFAAALDRSEIGREISPPARRPPARPVRAKTSPRAKAKKAFEGSPMSAATAAYRDSLKTGKPLTGAELGRLYGRTARWGQQLIAGLDND
ncbi:hypothetical protein [Streptomyces goshikiensis]|uniref:hypothetical protein n=1 Tax=Streptomyces goshikiensis TaxID=1942 RepID=UPI002E14031D|nr:hypothetical protein OG224_06785 [Streptomyces goshikiensis]